MILSHSGNIAGGRSLVPGNKLSIPHTGAVSAQRRARDARRRWRADCSRMSRMPQDATATPAAPAPPFAGVLALGLALGLGGMLVVIPALRLALPTTESSAALLPDHHQDAETLAFALAFLVVLPLAGFAGHRLAARLLSAVGERALLSVGGMPARGVGRGRSRDPRRRGGRARQLIRLAVGAGSRLVAGRRRGFGLVARPEMRQFGSCRLHARAGPSPGYSARERRSPSSTSVRSPVGVLALGAAVAVVGVPGRESRRGLLDGQPGPGGRRSTSPWWASW